MRCYYCNFVKATTFKIYDRETCWECLLNQMGHRCESSDLRARLQAVEAENERLRDLLVRVWRQGDVNPGSKLYEDMERFFAAQPAESRAAAAEKDAAGWKKLWAEAQTACAKHARSADALQAQIAQAEAKLKTMSKGFDAACQDRDDLRAVLTVGEDDLRYIAEQCEAVGRVDGVSLQESRTWKVVGRLARQAAKKLEAALRQSKQNATKENHG